MKKIILLFFIFCTFGAYAIKAPEEGYWKKELKLNASQQEKIKKIEIDTNAKILLLSMEMAMAESTDKKRELNIKINNAYRQQQKDISNELNFFQKRKYKAMMSVQY